MGGQAVCNIARLIILEQVTTRGLHVRGNLLPHVWK